MDIYNNLSMSYDEILKSLTLEDVPEDEEEEGETPPEETPADDTDEGEEL